MYLIFNGINLIIFLMCINCIVLKDCTAISMGQGQEVHARRVLNEFMMEGGWILLQNLHLALNYVDELFDNISDPSRNIHQSFRFCIFPLFLFFHQNNLRHLFNCSCAY